MAIKLQHTNEMLHHIKCLAYSDAGVGKTVLCRTAPNVIVLSAESGLLSLQHDNIPYIEMRSVIDVTEAYEWALDSHESKQFETISLDSITEIAEVLLSAYKKQYTDARQAYGQMNDDMSVLIRKFRDLPGKHVYFSAKKARTVDENSGITKYHAMMPGKTLVQGLPFFFDEVFAMHIGHDEDGDYRYIQAQPSLSHDAKDRSGALGKMTPPNLTYIFDRILGKNPDLKKIEKAQGFKEFIVEKPPEKKEKEESSAEETKTNKLLES